MLLLLLLLLPVGLVMQSVFLKVDSKLYGDTDALAALSALTLVLSGGGAERVGEEFVGLPHRGPRSLRRWVARRRPPVYRGPVSQSERGGVQTNFGFDGS